jgi:hypothetical protein
VSAISEAVPSFLFVKGKKRTGEEMNAWFLVKVFLV